MHTTDQLTAALADRYRIAREIGAGGMATVYLAHDIRHDRDVAIKVLHPDLGAALGGERFLSEIKTTAKLQHPHILPLLDSGDANGSLYYVMPFVAGESLRARLEREGQLPVDDSVRIALEIADAIGYAHSVGVIHRDIKPENILLQNGHALVADFGIAVAMQQAGGLRLTQSGMSIGTPQYMSPEQSMAERSLDARSDIYSLGAVLYEMLIGEPPFTGPTAQVVVARRMSELPRSVAAERPSVPASIDNVVLRALQRTPADRFATARDFATALSAWRTDSTPAAFNGQPIQKRQSRLILALATALAATTGIALWNAFDRPATPQPASTARFALSVDRDGKHFLGGGRDAFWGRPASTAIALSPDGTQLVYAAWESDSAARISSQLYIRSLADERALPIPGTEGASTPFFSPDGKWIGFFVGRSIRRAPVGGGAVQTVGTDSAQNWYGASWGDDGAIVVTSRAGLYRVSASGGEITLVAPIDSGPNGFVRYDQPHVLPGSKIVLFHGQRTYNASTAEILAINIASKQITSVLTNGMNPLLAGDGTLLFARQGKLMAVPFDPIHAKVTRQPASVMDDVMQAIAMPNVDWESGATQVAISQSGHLAYVSGGTYPRRVREIVRVSPDGNVRTIGSELREYNNVRVSPTGDRLLLQARADSGRRSSVLIHDLERGVTSSVNTGGFQASRPLWSPDGRQIAFSSDRESFSANIFVLATDGSSPPKRVAPSTRSQVAAAWSRQGVLSYLEGGRIWGISQGEAPHQLSSPSVGASSEQFPSFSPDGHWLAYSTSDNGQPGVFVRPYPGPGSAVKIAAGSAPTWVPNGKRLYFLGGPVLGPWSMMAVDVVPGDTFRTTQPVKLFDWTNLISTPVASYDVFPDGSVAVVVDSGTVVNGRMTVGASEHTRFRVSEMHVVLNFLDELRARMSR